MSECLCVYIYIYTKQQCPLMTQIVVVCPKLTHKVCLLFCSHSKLCRNVFFTKRAHTFRADWEAASLRSEREKQSGFVGVRKRS